MFKYIDLSYSNLRNANLEKSVFLKIYQHCPVRYLRNLN